MHDQQTIEARIESWMRTITRDGGVARYDDLHIDQLEPDWVRKEKWIDGGLMAFRIAVRLRERYKMPFTVVLAFSLESGECRRGVNFGSRDELQRELDWSPPSLYLFPPGQDFLGQPDVDAVTVDEDMLFGNQDTKACMYLEFRPRELSEYSRSVLLAA